LTKLLQDYWFSVREAKVYLTCLEFWEDIVSSVARRAGENRVTTYSILKDLTLKGIANEVIKNNKKYYSVISPEKLVKKQKDKYQKLKEALPELMAITSEYAKKPQILYYEWTDGIINIFDSMLESKETIKSIIWKEKLTDEFEQYLYKEYQKKRIEQGIPTQIIYSKQSKIKIQQHEMFDDKEKLRETIIIPKDSFNIKSSIRVYGLNKVSFIMHNKNKLLSWLVIESKDLHQSFLSVFELMRAAHRQPGT